MSGGDVLLKRHILVDVIFSNHGLRCRRRRRKRWISVIVWWERLAATLTEPISADPWMHDITNSRMWKARMMMAN